MSNNYTITLSLGSGPEAEALASRIKSWAGSTPISEAIRNVLKDTLAIYERKLSLAAHKKARKENA